MERTLIEPGGDERWGPEPVVAVVLIAVVYLATDVGVLVASLGTLGLLLAYGGVRSTWHLVASRSVTREPIGSLGPGDGAVEVGGTARPADGTVTAPLSGAESIAYRVEVFRREPSRDDS